MPQNNAANNFSTTLAAALFGSAGLSTALTEGTAVSALSVSATDGPIASGDTLTLAESSAITLAVGSTLSTTLATALAEGTSYTSLTAAAAGSLPQNVTVALQDTASTALTTALTEGTAVTSLACNATSGALGVGAILLLSVTSGATLATALTSGTQYTSITVGAASAALTIASGALLQLVSGSDTQTVTTSASATLSTTADTTISVQQFTANFAYPSGAAVNVQQNAAVSTAAAAAATSIAIYSMTPVFSFGTATVLYAQQNWTTSAATSTTTIPVNSATALYAFSTAATVTAAPPTTATVQGVTYTSLLVGALSGALGNGATITLPNGESTTTSAAAASAATVVSVSAVQAKGSYASGADITVSQAVTAAANAAGVTSLALSGSTTPLWSYSTASTVTAATSAISLTSTTGAPSAYPYLLSLTKAGSTYPNPANPLEIVQVTASGACTRGVEGSIAAWAAGDGAGCDFTTAQFSGLTQGGWLEDQSGMDVYPLLRFETVSSSGSSTLEQYPSWNGTTANTGTTPNSAINITLSGGSYSPAGVLVANVPDPSIHNGAALRVLFNLGTLPALTGDMLLLRLTPFYSLGNGQGVQVACNGSALVTNIYDEGQLSPSSVSISDTNLHEVFMKFTSSGTTVWIDGELAGTCGAISGGPPYYYTIYMSNGGGGTNITFGLAGAWYLQSRKRVN